MTSRVVRTPVLVVGAGLVGAVLALELAHHGVRCIVVERPAPLMYPRTYYINSRSMELLRRLKLADPIRKEGVDPDHSTDILWTKHLAEPPVLVWHQPSVNHIRRRLAAVNDGTAPVEPYQRVSGPSLDQLGWEAIAKEPLVELRLEWEIGQVTPTPRGVTATVVDRDAGVTHTVRAGYVAACGRDHLDRFRDLDIEMDDSMPKRRFRSAHFSSGDLMLRRFGSPFTTIAADELTLVSHGGGEWTLSVPDRERDPGPLARLCTSLGVPLDVHNVHETEWEGSLSVAQAYRKGRAYLVGDAAHAFYPTGGYAENTGIADAVDLGWKLAATVKGWGGPKLLASYDEERRPVALFNRELSGDLVEVGRRFTRLVLAGASREQLAGVLEHDVHRIDDLGVQLGYRYDQSSVICHERDDPPTWQWRRITASTWPGQRGPAVRMADGSQLFDRFEKRAEMGFSLVDLSGRGIGEPLVAAAKARRVPMLHVPVDDAAVRACWERDLVLIRPDQHVAWRGDTPPGDWETILDRVTGNAVDGDYGPDMVRAKHGQHDGSRT